MRQNIFNTRQRAEEIIKEAVAIWQRGFNSEQLEGIEQDPVFSLFMTALAYQANEIDNEVEQLQEEILDELTRLLIPYEKIHPLPATALVEVRLDDRIPELTLDQRCGFILPDTDYTFIPILKTRAINAEIQSVVRIDNRRWKVGLKLKGAVKQLSGMTFLVGNPHFHDLKLYANGAMLPLVKPWDYSDLPLNECFSIDNMVYNKSLTYQASNTWFDLFAQQNARLFYIDSHKGSDRPFDRLELIFEFIGIDDQFTFDKEQLSLNATILANVAQRSVTLSAAAPIARLSSEGNKQQFLHLIAPDDNQLYPEVPIEIRRVATDRFNAERLTRLASTLVSRFSSDYYAFQKIEVLREGKFMEQFYTLLKKISDGLSKSSSELTSSLYLLLRNDRGFHPKEVSLQVNYLTTDGSSVNSDLNAKSNFAPLANTYIQSVRQLANPMPGYDEIQSENAQDNLARYYMITNDRIVTPADVKILCYNELERRFGITSEMRRFGITSEMIAGIKVKQAQKAERHHYGFETQVYISLTENAYIKRNFTDKIPMTELILQKMIEVRSTNVFPVVVNIEVVQSDPSKSA